MVIPRSAMQPGLHVAHISWQQVAEHRDSGLKAPPWPRAGRREALERGRDAYEDTMAQGTPSAPENSAGPAPAIETPAGDPKFYAQGGRILLGASHNGIECIELKFANRHGLVTGATGTGKTVTLQVLAEGFSAAGVPVFAADIKGDLSGIAAIGEQKPHLVQRAKDIGLPGYANAAFPVTFWDMFGEKGHPIRATVAEMGPLLLSRLLELTEEEESAQAKEWLAMLMLDGQVPADERIIDALTRPFAGEC